MGMLKPIVAGGAAALASEDAEAGYILNSLGKPVLEAWHGGLKGIDRFRDEYLGTGEGAHVYTHGHYLADQWKTSRHYYNDRARQYEADRNYEIWSPDIIYKYGEDERLMRFEVSDDAPPLFLSVREFTEITSDAISRYGTNVDAAKDYVSRKMNRIQPERLDEARDLLSQYNNGEYEFDTDAIWRIQSRALLEKMTGMNEQELKRSLLYDLGEQLPADISLTELSEQAKNRMLTDIVADRLELVEKRYTRETDERLMAANKPGKYTGGRLTNDYEFKLDPDLEDSLSGEVLLDWSKVNLPQEKQAGMYKVHVDVNPDDMLHWEKPLKDHPEHIKMAITDIANQILDNPPKHTDGMFMTGVFNDKGPYKGQEMSAAALIYELAKGNFPRSLTPAEFSNVFSTSVGGSRALVDGRQLSQMLKAKGVKGMQYRDGWTRHRDGNWRYNYVIYDDSLISIMERGASTAPMNLLLAMGVGTGLAAPVLDKKIAERFPMPQEEPGMMERIASNPNVQAAMKHPVTQYIGQQFDNAEWPSRMLTGVIEGIANLTQGESAADTGRQFVNRMQTPYEDTTQEVGQYVLKKTGSPAAAAVASTGMLVGDITNWIGP